MKYQYAVVDGAGNVLDASQYDYETAEEAAHAGSERAKDAFPHKPHTDVVVTSQKGRVMYPGMDDPDAKDEEEGLQHGLGN